VSNERPPERRRIGVQDERRQAERRGDNDEGGCAGEERDATATEDRRREQSHEGGEPYLARGDRPPAAHVVEPVDGESERKRPHGLGVTGGRRQRHRRRDRKDDERE